MHNNHPSHSVVFYATAIIGILLFWGLRFYYWSITEEVPFSDMADYVLIAHKILDQWDFQHNPFWQSYKPPTLPLLGAAVFGIFGRENLEAWRIIQAGITFFGLAWSVFEIGKALNRWFGLALLWIVALSKSSIFWSLKFATEGVAEALGYLFIALVLFTLRKIQYQTWLFGLLGILCTIAILNRPQFLLVPPIFILGFLLFRYKEARKKPWNPLFKRNSQLVLVFFLGMILFWSPWLFRTYSLYGKIVPMSTQGPYSFLWEVGDVTLHKNDGTVVTRNREQLQSEAPSLFANDAEASAYAQQFVQQWLKDHWRSYPELVLKRAKRTLRDPQIYLTKVSRSELFPNSLNRFLLDKTYYLSLTGILGYFVLFFFFPRSLFILPVVAIVPWGFGTLFLGYPRIAEPNLPLILYGNCVWFLVLTSLIRRKNVASRILGSH